MKISVKEGGGSPTSSGFWKDGLVAGWLIRETRSGLLLGGVESVTVPSGCEKKSLAMRIRLLVMQRNGCCNNQKANETTIGSLTTTSMCRTGLRRSQALSGAYDLKSVVQRCSHIASHGPPAVEPASWPATYTLELNRMCNRSSILYLLLPHSNILQHHKDQLQPRFNIESPSSHAKPDSCLHNDCKATISTFNSQLMTLSGVPVVLRTSSLEPQYAQSSHRCFANMTSKSRSRSAIRRRCRVLPRLFPTMLCTV